MGPFLGARAHCPACGFIQFQNPKVAVAVLLTHGARVALVQRAVIPRIGAWALPAGFMDFDEQPSAAALRELYEDRYAR
ncbi:MAG: NUDIX domain-containing protein [Anaerolineae bacterium]|nr:MAG: NUDIX domain-containing protein [Anaerolineae bacterium]